MPDIQPFPYMKRNINYIGSDENVIRGSLIIYKTILCPSVEHFMPLFRPLSVPEMFQIAIPVSSNIHVLKTYIVYKNRSQM